MDSKTAVSRDPSPFIVEGDKIYQNQGNNVTVRDIYILEVLDKLSFSCDFRTDLDCSVDVSLPEVFNIIVDFVGKPYLKLKSFAKHSHVLIFSDIIVDIFIERTSTDAHESYFKAKKRRFNFAFYGNIDNVSRLYHLLLNQYPLGKSRYVSWMFDDNGSVETQIVELPVKNIPKDSYFPWIKPNIKTFGQNYLDSTANILLLLGPPGVGKSSWIRNFIHSHELSVVISSDEELMQQDKFFVRFITDNNRIMVLEDADVLLRDRTDGNRIMNKLLNTSDGLIQTNKKIIMTANITHLDEIDPALIRPGRCFEVLMFRELTHREAVIAAKDAGVPEPDGNVTLSQLFQTGPSTQAMSRIGF